MATHRHSVLPGYYPASPKQKKKVSHSKTSAKSTYSPSRFNYYNPYNLPTAQNGGGIFGIDMPDWLKTGIQVLDPTGITSWGDAGRAISEAWDNPSWGNVGNALLETFAAVPVVGKAGKALKIANRAARVGRAGKVAKAVSTAGKIMRPIKAVDRVGARVLKAAVSKPTRKAIQKISPKLGKKVNQVRTKIKSTSNRLGTNYPGITTATNAANRNARFWKAADQYILPSSEQQAKDIINTQVEQAPTETYNIQSGNDSAVNEILMLDIDSLLNDQDISLPDQPVSLPQQQYGGGYSADEIYDPSQMYYYAYGGVPTNPGFNSLPDAVQERIISSLMYGGNSYQMGGELGDGEDVPVDFYPEERYYPEFSESPDVSSLEEEGMMRPGSYFDMDIPEPVAFSTASSAPTISPKAALYPTPSAFNLQPYEGYSIVDFLKEQGLPYDYTSRKEIAKMVGIPNYRGTASQNLQLISVIQANPDVLSSMSQSASSGPRTSGGGRRTGVPSVSSSQDGDSNFSFDLNQQMPQAVGTNIVRGSSTPVPTAASSQRRSSKKSDTSSVAKKPQTSKKKASDLEGFNRKMADSYIAGTQAAVMPMGYNFQTIEPYFGIDRQLPPSRYPGLPFSSVLGLPPSRPLGLPASTTSNRALPSIGSNTSKQAVVSEVEKIIQRAVSRGTWISSDFSDLAKAGVRQSGIDKIKNAYKLGSQSSRMPTSPRIGTGSRGQSTQQKLSRIAKLARMLKEAGKYASRYGRFFRFEDGGDYSGTFSGNSYYDMGGDYPFGGVVHPNQMFADPYNLPEYQTGSEYDDLGEDEMYVTPEELEQLRQQGYDFDVI